AFYFCSLCRQSPRSFSASLSPKSCHHARTVTSATLLPMLPIPDSLPYETPGLLSTGILPHGGCPVSGWPLETTCAIVWQSTSRHPSRFGFADPCPVQSHAELPPPSPTATSDDATQSFPTHACCSGH